MMLAAGDDCSQPSSHLPPPNLEPPPTLESFPPETLHCIFSHLSLRSAGTFATACSSFAASFASLPKNDALFRRALLARLRLSVHTPTAAGEEGEAAIAWRDELQEIQSLFSQLRELGNIESDGQKYLRWCDGIAADSWLIHHALVGLSLLPPKIEDLVTPQTDRGTRPLTKNAQLLLQYFLGEGMLGARREMEMQMEGGRPRTHQEEEDVEELCQMREAATRAFDVGRFSTLLRWMTTPPTIDDDVDPWRKRRQERRNPASLRLRIMMAEIGQIETRSTHRFLHLLSKDSDKMLKAQADWPGLRLSCRQEGAFVHLHRLAQCDPDRQVDYWA